MVNLKTNRKLTANSVQNKVKGKLTDLRNYKFQLNNVQITAKIVKLHNYCNYLIKTKDHLEN
jgi:hypothetical protein